MQRAQFAYLSSICCVLGLLTAMVFAQPPNKAPKAVPKPAKPAAKASAKTPAPAAKTPAPASKAPAAVPAPIGTVVESRIVWVEGKPQVAVSIDAPPEIAPPKVAPAQPPAGQNPPPAGQAPPTPEIAVPIALFDAADKPLWQAVVKVSAVAERPWRGQLALEKIDDPKKQHRLDVTLRDQSLGVDYRERIYFGDEAATVQSYAFAAQGIFPHRKVTFVLGLAGFKGQDLRPIPVSVALRDGDDNAVLSRETPVELKNEPQLVRIDVTPDTTASVGPYALEVGIESESYGLFFNAAHKFSLPGIHVPVSSFEHGDPAMWFAAGNNTQPQRYQSLQYYYSEHLTQLAPHGYPKLSYDGETKHSGRQALRIDYQANQEAHAWGLQELPGKPAMLTVWVKGNGTEDQLVVAFEDRINYTLPAWQRNANFDRQGVCTLNFTDWRRFRVPVLGDGMQVPGFKGSTLEVDSPVRIMAFSILPGKLAEGQKAGDPRTVWIDDIGVETQIAATDVLSVELQASRADGLLTADGKLWASVGNGRNQPIKTGRLNLVARDAAGDTVLSTNRDIELPAEGFATAEFALQELFAKKPRGPIDVDVTVSDTTSPGTRGTTRIVLKNPIQAGVFHDFEEPVSFSSFQPGKVGLPQGKIVQGGADGKGHALSIEVKPKADNNSVLFQPALPGIVEHVELMVRGGSKPVVIQPWFIDSGFTGVWLRPYNVFWPDPITVDWQGWRKVSIAAPSVPPYLSDKNRYFLFKSWFPLNLALNVKMAPPPAQPTDAKTADAKPADATPEDAAAEAPVEIRFDDVRVVTHLPAKEEVRLDVEFPNETRIHPPGAPLRVLLYNYGVDEKPLSLAYELKNYQGFVAQSGKLDVKLPAGAKNKAELVASLAPGIYELAVTGMDAGPVKSQVMVLKAEDYFGAEPLAVLAEPFQLRRNLGLTTEQIYLDWDNTEAAPYMHHFNWFYEELQKRRDTAGLPLAMRAISQRHVTAIAAAAEADKGVAAAQAPTAAALTAHKQASDKVAATKKNVDVAKAEAVPLTKNFETAKAKSDAAAKDALDAKKKAEESAKIAIQTEADAKKAKATYDAAEKKAVDLEKAAADLEAKAKTAETNAATAQKAAADAEAAFKAAEKEAADADAAVKAADEELKKAKDANDQAAIDAATKKLQEATTKLEAAKKKLAEGQAKLDEAKKKSAEATALAVAARKDADTRKAEAVQAREAAKVALAELQKLEAKQKETKEVAAKDAAAAPVAAKLAETFTAETNKADAALKAAVAKTEAQVKQLAADEQVLADRAKALEVAKATLDKAAASAATIKTELKEAAKSLEDAYGKYAFAMLPIVGFSADWAGPEANEMIRRGDYSRFIPNLLQVPRNLNDWSMFVRTILREYHDRFDSWVFWENPDIDDAPQNIPPERYGPMLKLFHRWVKLYDPNGKVIAGGFNFSKALDYLERIPEPDKLLFDEIAVQMNLAELSPEHADVEGFLDELNELLKIRETQRLVRSSELDWGIAEFLSPMQQAAYHARAAMILDSRGATPHQFNLINTGFAFEGYGVAYRVPYGNTGELQTHLPYHVPKPSYFALIEMRKFLADWKYVQNVDLAGRSLSDHRAFVYRQADGRLATVLWRVVDGERVFRVPSQWQGIEVRDVFGFPVAVDKGLRCSALPTVVKLPAGYKLEQLVYDLRMLSASDDSHGVILDLHLAEADSTARAKYQATGQTATAVRSGTIPAGRKVRETFVEGIESETFTFTLPAAGDALLRRRWYFDGEGTQLTVQVGNGPKQVWNLTKGQGNEPGVRESTFVLRGCTAGENTIAIHYDAPGSCAGYRIEPLAGDALQLVRAGVLNSRQSKGDVQVFQSAVGTPLRIGKTDYAEGIGAHAVSFIEYPLAGQFDSFEVTVGIDGSTEGRGSAVFRIFVDGKEKANSGLISGFSNAKTLKVEKLGDAQRMILSVMDAGDGNQHDLANWVDGKLYLKKK